MKQNDKTTETPSAIYAISRQIRLGEALGFTITIIVIILSSWISAKTQITEIRVKQENTAKYCADENINNEKRQENILNELKEINEKISAIKIDLVNKKNRD
jgi:hypothetical protein